MQDWLPIIAALVGALATFGVWAYVSRQRLASQAAELERTLEARTDGARVGAHPAAAAEHRRFADRGRQSRTVPRIPRARVAPRAARRPAADADLHRHRSLPRLQPRVRPQGRRRSAEAGRPRAGRHRRAAGRPRRPAIIATSSRWCWHRPTARARSTSPNSVRAVDRRTADCRRPRTRPPPWSPRRWPPPPRCRSANRRGKSSILIKAARHALREARATGGNRVLRANLGHGRAAGARQAIDSAS